MVELSTNNIPEQSWAEMQANANPYRGYAINSATMFAINNSEFHFEGFLEKSGWEDTTKNMLRVIRLANRNTLHRERVAKVIPSTKPKITFPEGPITTPSSTLDTHLREIAARMQNGKIFMQHHAPAIMEKAEEELARSIDVFSSLGTPFPEEMHPLLLDPTHQDLFVFDSKLAKLHTTPAPHAAD